MLDLNRGRRRMRIVLLGKPGSGKGTLAAKLRAELSLPHLSSGAILREQINRRTPIGVRIEEHVKKGEIGPQELIADMMIGHIERNGHTGGYILDGFPRTMEQAGRLEEAFPPDLSILIEVPDDLAMERISKRLTCRGCGGIFSLDPQPAEDPDRCSSCGGMLEMRGDDSPGAVTRRLETYRDEVMPVIAYYRGAGRLLEIDGTGSPAVVYVTVKSAISGR
jgi:adenylate kinase